MDAAPPSQTDPPARTARVNVGLDTSQVLVHERTVAWDRLLQVGWHGAGIPPPLPDASGARPYRLCWPPVYRACVPVPDNGLDGPVGPCGKLQLCLASCCRRIGKRRPRQRNSSGRGQYASFAGKETGFPPGLTFKAEVIAGERASSGGFSEFCDPVRPVRSARHRNARD